MMAISLAGLLSSPCRGQPNQENPVFLVRTITHLEFQQLEKDRNRKEERGRKREREREEERKGERVTQRGVYINTPF